MTREDFLEVQKENVYIRNILERHKVDIEGKLESFFHGLRDKLGEYDFIVCSHTHYSDIKTTVYNGTDIDSQSLTIENFQVVEKTDNFNEKVFELVETWIKEQK